MPNSLLSTASRLCRGSSGSAKIASSDCGEPLARAAAVDREVLVAVGNPDVGDAGRAERLADRGADLPAGDAVLDPELADALVGLGEREAVGRFGMREAGRIEIHADAATLGPVDPALEMLGRDLVAVDALAAELAVERVQVEAMLAGNQRIRFFEIGPQLVGRAGLARDSCR